MQLPRFAARAGEPELAVDLLQQPQWRKGRVENQSGPVGCGIELVEQGADDGGLAGSHFA